MAAVFVVMVQPMVHHETASQFLVVQGEVHSLVALDVGAVTEPTVALLCRL